MLARLGGWLAGRQADGGRSNHELIVVVSSAHTRPAKDKGKKNRPNEWPGSGSSRLFYCTTTCCTSPVESYYHSILWIAVSGTGELRRGRKNPFYFSGGDIFPRKRHLRVIQFRSEKTTILFPSLSFDGQVTSRWQSACPRSASAL